MNTSTEERDPLATLQIRVHGDTARPALIYLPGLHGDWTLVTGFRAALKGRVRFVEFSYPRNLTWTLDDYAAAIEEALQTNHLSGGWLLGESFGSQIVWALLKRGQANGAGFRAAGVILAGGFVRHPTIWGVRLTYAFNRRAPAWGLRFCFRLFAQYARQRHGREPEVLANVEEFIRRRLEPLDQQAICHRLKLIADNDPRPIARQARLPVYSLAGLVDPLVPLPWVRHWLKHQCPGYRGGRTLPCADHNVLGTASRAAAEQVLQWMTAVGQARALGGVDFS